MENFSKGNQSLDGIWIEHHLNESQMIYYCTSMISNKIKLLNFLAMWDLIVHNSNRKNPSLNHLLSQTDNIHINMAYSNTHFNIILPTILWSTSKFLNKVFTLILVKVLWVVMPCNIILGYQYQFEGLCCLQLQGEVQPQQYTASQPRRPWLEFSLMWQHQSPIYFLVHVLFILSYLI